MSVEGLRGSSDRSVLILTSLADGPKNGYALIKDIEEFAGVKMGPGTLYGCLSKLERLASSSTSGSGSSPSLPDHRPRLSDLTRATSRVGSHRETRVEATCGHRMRGRSLVDRLIRFYPGDWRDRYGDEVHDLVDELMATEEFSLPRIAAGLLVSAFVQDSDHGDPRGELLLSPQRLVF